MKTWETLHQQRSEAGSSAATEGVENEKALKSAAIVGDATNAVQHRVDDLLPDGVVSTCIVVGGVLFAGDQLFRMEEMFVGPSANLVFKY